MRETQVIERIRAVAQTTNFHRQIIKGIGDDCAVLRPRAGHDVVFTTDFTIQDRHFTLETHSAADIGHKALARSVSDLAGMGADPLFCLVSLAIPGTLKPAWILAFYKGLIALAARERITLAGGDLARSSHVTVDVMSCGSVPRGSALLREGARPKEGIYVTGELGLSALGLQSKRGKAWLRHKRPQPRIDVGKQLRRFATAAMDISDGLSLDLLRLCQQSGVGARLEKAIPIAKGASLDQALHGGEDYELLFTAPAIRKVPATIAGVPVTRIGEITPDAGIITYGGEPLEPLGFDHFR